MLKSAKLMELQMWYYRQAAWRTTLPMLLTACSVDVLPTTLLTTGKYMEIKLTEALMSTRIYRVGVVIIIHCVTSVPHIPAVAVQ